VNVLIHFGTKKPVARTLVYLLNIKEGTMQAIELGTGLSQPQVSTALKYMEEQRWVLVSAAQHEGKGRPKKIISLVKSVRNDLEIIGKGKKIEREDYLARVRKARVFAV